MSADVILGPSFSFSFSVAACLSDGDYSMFLVFDDDVIDGICSAWGECTRGVSIVCPPEKGLLKVLVINDNFSVLLCSFRGLSISSFCPITIRPLSVYVRMLILSLRKRIIGVMT
jgi:hypothetical protein